MKIERVVMRLILLITICVVASARTARAQQPAMGLSMPSMDLSRAPKDIQAIWKKLQSGGVPTPAEAQRLSAWMQAHASEIQQSMTGQAQSAQQAASAVQHGTSGLAGSGSDAQCPARSPVLAQLGAAAPSQRAALALLDTIRATYAALERPTTVQLVQRALAPESVPALRERGAASLLGGYDALTVLAYVEAVRRATGADVQGAWGDLGAALVELDDPAHAVSVLRYALTLGPRSPLVVHNLGVAYADLGDLKSATTLLTEVTRAAPHFGGAYDALAKVESCAGNMTAAWHAMAQAQEVDWTSDREQKLDAHETPSAQSDDDASADDAAEAAKPFPMPQRPSAFAPPPAVRGASSFQPATPALPDTWRDALARQAFYESQATQYGVAASAALDRGMRDESGTQAEMANEAGAEDAAAHGMRVITVSLTNGKDATDAADVVARRAGARMTMVERAFGEKMVQIATAGQAHSAPLDAQRVQCHKAHPTAPAAVCTRPYCKAMNAVWDQSYADARAAGRVAIGGLSGIPGELQRAMLAWFAWAGDPGSRSYIDAVRLQWLATLQAHAFGIAARVADYTSSWKGSLCDNESFSQSSESAEAQTGLPNDPGACEKKTLNDLVLRVTEDCSSLSIVLTPFVIGGPQGRVSYHAATSSRTGTMFATVGVGIGPAGPLNVLEGHAGVGLTLDQAGSVTGFGPAAGGGFGSSLVTGRLSGTGMINLLPSGPAVAGESYATPPLWMAFAGSPHFGGAM